MKQVIVADIGGTHTRFGVWNNGTLEKCDKVKTAAFKTIADSVVAYKQRNGLEEINDFAFATAANLFGDGIWRFTNLKAYDFSLDDFTSSGLNILLSEDDFAATAYGCITLPPNAESKIIVKEGLPRESDPRIVLGPGTGLGLAYGLKRSDGLWRAQRTYGGHMLFTPVTDLQYDIQKRLIEKRGLDRPVVFEDMCCGSLFPSLYSVCCDIAGTKPQENFLEDTGNEGFRLALKTFHESLGLFTHLCVVTIHGYGGVFMNGGFLDALIERNLWSSKEFLISFHQSGVPVMEEVISKTPISIVCDTYISLHGLGKMLHA